MNRLIRTIVLGLAVLVPAQAARAVTPGGTYDFCGGNSFTFCASINLSVSANARGGYTVAMVVANRSTTNDGFAPAEFSAIGLENVLPPGQQLATPSNFQLKQGEWDGTTFSNGVDICGTDPWCWSMATESMESGGVRVDFAAQTTFGSFVSLSSNCSWDEPTYGEAPLATCARGDDLTQWRPVQISFDVTQGITSADLYVSAFGPGQMQQSCVTGQTCMLGSNVPPVTATPEPATLALLGSGLAGLGGAYRRRRQKQSVGGEVA